jgi:hypothetical protein
VVEKGTSSFEIFFTLHCREHSEGAVQLLSLTLHAVTVLPAVMNVQRGVVEINNTRSSVKNPG